ncbi:MAG TPA: AMP-binding protein [Acidimicrobiales bacterium]|nr:AMP-binding protein [Acidimicrobiales bacterium]
MAKLVAIDLPGGPDFVDALRRIWDDGDAALPVDQRLPEGQRRRVMAAMAPSEVEGRGGRTSLEGGRPVEDGDALVMPTSGTTGTPKGVVLTRRAVEASALATTGRLGVDPLRHRWLACLPLCHVGGLSVVTRALLTGTPLTALPGFDAGAVTAASGPEVFVSLVPTALRRVDARRFHTVVLGGSAPPAGLADNVVTTYGMTETGSGVVYDGVPLPGVEVDVRDRQEIFLRGPMLLRCYRDGSVPLDDGGWLATGDAGRVDPAGRLQVYGRLDDMIVTGGENVWPGQVEDALRSHPAVAEVAVAGLPDVEWGQRVAAWVVPADPSEPPSLEQLRDVVGAELPRFAAPRQLVLVDSLPRTSIGKVRRSELRAG